MNNKNFYIAAYNSSVAGNAGVLGGPRDAKRSLHFNGADYSSEEDSPYAPAIRKAKGLERRRNMMASEEVAKSRSVFQKMGIVSGGDSDEDEEEEEEVAPTMAVAVEEEEEHAISETVNGINVDNTNEIEAIKAVHEEKLSAAKQQIELLSKKLAAAVEDTEALSSKFQVAQAQKLEIEDTLHIYEDQIAQSRRLLDEKASLEQASMTEVTTLRTKTELLERQVATLQASGERAEAERSIFAAENAELNDKLKETLAQLANTEQGAQTANDTAVVAVKELAQRRENALRSEVKNLEEELSVVQNALNASNEASEAATRRATEARQNATRAQEEKRSADKVADDALVEAEYLRGEIMKLEREIAVASEKFAAVEAAAELLQAQHATEINQLTLKLQLAESENARMLEESALHEKQALEIHAMVVEDARVSAPRDAEKAKMSEKLAAAEAEISKLQAEKTAFQEQSGTACARTAAIEAQLMATQQEFDLQIHSLTEQLTLMQQQNDEASRKAASQQGEEIEILKQKLATLESEASKTAVAHSMSLYDANKRIKEAEARCEIAEKQHAATTTVVPDYNLNFAGSAGGGSGSNSSRYGGLVERKRTEFSNIDLETGGTVSYDSDRSHDGGEERGPLTVLALRFRIPEIAVNVAKKGDRVTLAGRSLLQRQHRASRVLVFMYLLALHVLLLTGRMYSAM